MSSSMAEAPLRIVSYNIRFGGGRRVPLLAAVLASLEPDVVILQEATDPRVVERLAVDVGLPNPFYRPGWSVAALLRHRPTAVDWHAPRRARGFLTISPDGADLRITGVHLPAGLSSRGEFARSRQVEIVIATLGGRADDQSLIVGDLNAVARGDEPLVAGMPLWLRAWLRFDGGIRTDVLDRLARSGWRDAYRVLHPEEPGFTLPSSAPRVRLDYLLAPERVIPRVRVCEPLVGGTLVARASDHLPLLAVVEASAPGAGSTLRQPQGDEIVQDPAPPT